MGNDGKDLHVLEGVNKKQYVKCEKSDKTEIRPQPVAVVEEAAFVPYVASTFTTNSS